VNDSGYKIHHGPVEIPPLSFFSILWVE